MRDLKDCRQDIDRIDSSILKLLLERMNVANDIALYKLEHNQSITDPVRENAKLKTLREKAHELGLPPGYISDLYKLIMRNTCAVEQQVIIARANGDTIKRDTSVAHLGEPGSYSHVAAMKYLEGFTGEIKTIGCDSFDKIVGLVETGKTEFGVLPIENSSSGSINEVLDVIQNTKASMVGELFVPIDHAVLGTTMAEIGEITDIYSHPQPITQCSAWIKDLAPHASIHYTKSTSEAMRLVKEKDLKGHVAIASHMAADYYSLLPLADNIANNHNNFTRFIVISMTPISVPDTIAAKTSLAFGVHKYTPGSLNAVLSEIANHNINLTKIISRPKIDNIHDTWEEVFFADIEGNLNSPAVADILEEIKPYTSSLKVLGCYADNEMTKNQEK